MKTFIFDLYNTLVSIHTDEHREESWREVVGFLAMRGMYTDPFVLMKLYDEGWAKLLVDLFDKNKYSYPEGNVIEVYKFMANALGGWLSDEDATECAKIARKASIIDFGLFDGTVELLKELRSRGAKLYILSNAQSSFTKDEIESTGIAELFDGILLSSDHGCRKPDTAFFAKLFDKYKLDRSDSVMIGDECASDGKGASDFGIKFLETKGGAAAHADEILGLIG